MYRLWLSVLGAGFSPVAPGTCGSAVVTILFVVAALLGLSGGQLLGLLLIVALHGCVVTVLYGQRFIDKYGPDPGPVVSDEQAGQALTYCWLWSFAGGVREILAVALVGFFLFRLFDIFKPPPVRQLETLPGAWGVLLDDVMAGVYAAATLQIIVRVPTWQSMLGIV